MSTQWFYRNGADEIGPVSSAELKQLAVLGQLRPNDAVRRADQAEWTSAERIKGLFPPSANLVRSPTPPPLEPLEPVPVKLLDAVPHSTPQIGLAGNRKLLLFGGIGCGVLTLLGGLTSLLLILVLVTAQPTISDAKAEQQIAQAVGFVVCGAKVTTASGEEYQEGLPIVRDRKLVSSLGTGSCFAVSEDGYLITNKHVIEGVWKARKSPLYDNLKKDLNLLVQPSVWVFFGKDKYEAEMVHVSSDYDMSILKIPRKHRPFFALSSTDKQPRTLRVSACGFPGLAQKLKGEGELLKLQLAQKKGTRLIEQNFMDRDFDYVQTVGSVNKIAPVEEHGILVQHDAKIHRGNSGGPLISDDGRVVGINTLGTATGDVFDSAIYYSVSMAQLRKEIDKHVPRAVWK